jgi:putative restriction endonuclease
MISAAATPAAPKSNTWLQECGNHSDVTSMTGPRHERAEREGANWSRAEHIIAFNLYNQIPFGTIHMRNPKVIELAALLGRSVGSVSYKLSNFARLDPALQARGIRGSQHGAKGEEEGWLEFAEDPERLAYESASLLADRLHRPLEEVAEIEESDLPPPGIEREAIVRLRVNQSFFRQRVLSAYGLRCCVTGLAVPQLLVGLPTSRPGRETKLIGSTPKTAFA